MGQSRSLHRGFDINGWPQRRAGFVPVPVPGFHGATVSPILKADGLSPVLMISSFLGVDAYWAFCMAVNIYLVFFRGYNTKQLRGLDHKYLFACYGFSLIPAIAYLFIKTKDRGPIYGGAVVSTISNPLKSIH